MRTTFCLAAVLAAATGTTAVAQQSTTGNGAPSGTHYDLNIIGVSHDKNANMNQASGNVIFVALGANGASVSTNIQLSPGPFQVLDKNGTDGVASFQLPADSTGAYTVWARALAKPGGQSNIVTCADTGTALTGTGQVCSTQHEVFLRVKGKSTFKNVTTSLTTITLTITAADLLNPTVLALLTCLGLPTTTTGDITIPLFSPCLNNFLWQYNNQGLKLLQLRFYPT